MGILPILRRSFQWCQRIFPDWSMFKVENTLKGSILIMSFLLWDNHSNNRDQSQSFPLCYIKVYNQTVRINVCEPWSRWDIILRYWPGMNLRWPILPIRDFPVSPARKSSPNGNLYWPSLFGQDGWILASFSFVFFFLPRLHLGP